MILTDVLYKFNLYEQLHSIQCVCVCVYITLRCYWILYYCIVCLICLSVCLLSSCSSIIDPPDYNQPPGFGGTTQVSLRNC